MKKTIGFITGITIVLILYLLNPGFFPKKTPKEIGSEKGGEIQQEETVQRGTDETVTGTVESKLNTSRIQDETSDGSPVSNDKPVSDMTGSDIQSVLMPPRDGGINKPVSSTAGTDNQFSGEASSPETASVDVAAEEKSVSSTAGTDHQSSGEASSPETASVDVAAEEKPVSSTAGTDNQFSGEATSPETASVDVAAEEKPVADTAGSANQFSGEVSASGPETVSADSAPEKEPGMDSAAIDVPEPKNEQIHSEVNDMDVAKSLEKTSSLLAETKAVVQAEQKQPLDRLSQIDTMADQGTPNSKDILETKSVAAHDGDLSSGVPANKAYFWEPFGTQVKAKGFAAYLSAQSKVSIAVERKGVGEYRIYFPYENEADKIIKKEMIEKTGVKITIDH